MRIAADERALAALGGGQKARVRERSWKKKRSVAGSKEQSERRESMARVDEQKERKWTSVKMLY